MTGLPTEKSYIAQSILDHIALYYGPPGVGKTTFVNDLTSKCLFISSDRGTRHLKVYRKEVGTWEEVRRVVSLLEREKRKSSLMYEMVALDHIDDLSYMAEIYVCTSLGIDSLAEAEFGTGWRLHRKELWATMQRILNLGTGLALIAHETSKTIKIPKRTERIMPDLTKGAWKVLIPKCDIVGYCGFKVVKSQEKRTITTQPSEHIYAKDRTRKNKPESGWELLKGPDFVATFGRPRVNK